MTTEHKAQATKMTERTDIRTNGIDESTEAKLIAAATKALLRMSGVAENLIVSETKH